VTKREGERAVAAIGRGKEARPRHRLRGASTRPRKPASPGGNDGPKANAQGGGVFRALADRAFSRMNRSFGKGLAS
jgi:hypothetical protein